MCGQNTILLQQGGIWCWQEVPTRLIGAEGCEEGRQLRFQAGTLCLALAAEEVHVLVIRALCGAAALSVPVHAYAAYCAQGMNFNIAAFINKRTMTT